jgi:hypothetical protein
MRVRTAIFTELQANLSDSGNGGFGYAEGCSDSIIAKRVGTIRQIVTNMRITEFGKLYKKPKPVKEKKDKDRGLAIPYGTLCEMVRSNEDMILALKRELIHLKLQLGADI